MTSGASIPPNSPPPPPPTLPHRRAGGRHAARPWPALVELHDLELDDRDLLCEVVQPPVRPSDAGDDRGDGCVHRQRRDAEGPDQNRGHRDLGLPGAARIAVGGADGRIAVCGAQSEHALVMPAVRWRVRSRHPPSRPRRHPARRLRAGRTAARAERSRVLVEQPVPRDRPSGRWSSASSNRPWRVPSRVPTMTGGSTASSSRAPRRHAALPPHAARPAPPNPSTSRPGRVRSGSAVLRPGRAGGRSRRG